MAIARKRISSGPREKIIFCKEPAAHRKVDSKLTFEVNVQVSIPMIKGTATSSLKKCPTSARNKEVVFKKGDNVAIPKTFCACSDTTKVWVIVEREGKAANPNTVYGREFGEVYDCLSEVKECGVMLEATKIGMACKDPKVRHANPEKVECYYLEPLGMWVEKDLLKKNDGDVFVLDTDKLMSIAEQPKTENFDIVQSFVPAK